MKYEGVKYVAVDIGCIECGEKSYVLGIFDKEEDACAVANACWKVQNKNWTGQHSFKVFPVAQHNCLCCLPHYASRSDLADFMPKLGIEDTDD